MYTILNTQRSSYTFLHGYWLHIMNKIKKGSANEFCNIYHNFKFYCTMDFTNMIEFTITFTF